MLAKIIFDISAIDGFAITVTLVGYIIVFIALVVLYYVYRIIPRLIKMNIRQKLLRQGKTTTADLDQDTLTGEENAAIAMALYLYLNEIHDEESTVMTIKRVSKRYSPWSSKIYGLNLPPK